MNQLPFRNIAGSKTHIDQWLEKILLTSYRHEAAMLGQGNLSTTMDDLQNFSEHDTSTTGDHVGHRCYSQHFSALKELGLDRASLESCGADKTSQERLYRSLFVYCNGVNEFISDYGRINTKLPFKIWEAFFRLFQYYDPQCREMFLKYLFDTQNHNMQQVIADLQESNSKLKDEKDALVQDLFVAKVNFSSVQHEKSIQMNSLEAMRCHLQCQLQDCKAEYDALMASHITLKEAYKASISSLSTVKEVIPQLILKLRRTIEESQRSATFTENYRREYDVLLNINKKLESQISDLNDELTKTKRLVIERNFTIESLQERDKELNARMINNQLDVDKIKQEIEDIKSIEEAYLQTIDDLVRIVEMSKQKLATCHLAVGRFERLYETKIHKKGGCTEVDHDFSDETIINLALKESTLPSRYRLVSTDQEIRSIMELPQPTESGLMQSILLPVITSNSNLQAKRSFMGDLREKLRLHIPGHETPRVEEDIIHYNNSNSGSNSLKCIKVGTLGDIDDVVVTESVFDNDYKLPRESSECSPNISFSPLAPNHGLSNHDYSQKNTNGSIAISSILNLLLYSELSPTVIHEAPTTFEQIIDKLNETVPLYKNLIGKYESLMTNYQALVYLHDNVDTQLITRLFGQVMEEKVQIQSLEHRVSLQNQKKVDLEDTIKELRATEEKYRVLEPKFIKMVEHYKERMIAKKKVEDDFSAAKAEIENLIQYKKRLRVCEERVDVMARELEEKTQIIGELQAERNALLLHHSYK